MAAKKGGDVGRVVQRIGVTLCAQYMDVNRIRACLGRCRKVESTMVLKIIARKGGPAEFRREVIRRVSWITRIIGVPCSTGESC